MRLGLLAGAIVIATAIAVTHASALECAFDLEDTITLEIESVTEDSQPIGDLSAYEPFEVHLEAWDGDEGFRLWATTDGPAPGDLRTWAESYEW